MSIIVSDRQQTVHAGTQASIRALVTLHATHERIEAVLRMALLLFAGITAFAVLDRLTGGWTVMDTTWMEDFASPLIKKSPVRCT